MKYIISIIVCLSCCNYVQGTDVICQPYECDDDFLRGDANKDNVLSLADVVAINNFLFVPGSPMICLEAADSNADVIVTIADSVYLANWLFIPGSPPPVGVFPALEPSRCWADRDENNGCPTCFIRGDLNNDGFFTFIGEVVFDPTFRVDLSRGGDGEMLAEIILWAPGNIPWEAPCIEQADFNNDGAVDHDDFFDFRDILDCGNIPCFTQAPSPTVPAFWCFGPNCCP